MRPIMTTLLFVALASLCACIALGQVTNPSGLKRKFKHDVKINSRYDSSSDKTTVVLNPYVVQVSSGSLTPDTISIMCRFTYKGRTLAALPDPIEFHVISDQCRGWQFDKEKDRPFS